MVRIAKKVIKYFPHIITKLSTFKRFENLDNLELFTKLSTLSTFSVCKTMFIPDPEKNKCFVTIR